MSYKASDVLKLIKAKKIEFVDLRFCDLLGTWQHTTFPVSEIDAGTFKDNGSASFPNRRRRYFFS